MSVLEYIEETNPAEVRELLLAAHHFLLETLPPFAGCAIKWRIPFYILRRNFCYLNRHPDHLTLGFPHGWKLAPRPGMDSLIATAPTNEPAQYANGSNNLNQSESVRVTANVSSPIATPQPTKLLPGNQGQKQNEKPKPTPAAEPTVTVSRSVVFALSVGVSRSGGGEVEKKIEPGVKDVELRLPLDVEREYDDFRVVVQDSDGNEVARREKLKATKKGNLSFVTAKIPAKRFKPDDYTVILSGGTKGVYQEAARYSFRVIK